MIEFTVYGTPIPQGSTRAFIPKGWKRPVITAANAKTKPWRQEISGAAFDLALPADWTAHQDRGVPLALWLYFFLAKPASTPKKRWAHTVKPDIDKLARAVADALTGTLFVDDSQLVETHLVKHYGTPERVEIRLAELFRLSETLNGLKNSAPAQMKLSAVNGTPEGQGNAKS